jgi:hypothetical protein
MAAPSGTKLSFVSPSLRDRISDGRRSRSSRCDAVFVMGLYSRFSWLGCFDVGYVSHPELFALSLVWTPAVR